MVSNIVDMKNEVANRRRANKYQAALNIRRIHPGLRKAFKVICAQRGIPMEQAVIDLIEGVVRGDITLSNS